MNTKNYYNRYWEEGGQRLSEYINLKQNIIKNIDTEISLVFDYGGGNGQTVELVKHKNNITIGDISQNVLVDAQKKGFKTIFIDDKFKFENLKEYDYILLLDCLEHMIDPEYIFRNIVKNLKDDAYLYVSVPNMLNIFTRIYFVSGKYIDFCDKNHSTNELFSEHIQLFSKDKLEKLIEKYELVITKKYFYMPKEIEFSKNLLARLLWSTLYRLKLYNFKPSLFSLCFFYVCKKR